MLGNIVGASLIVGPAGSGKTTALRERYVELVRGGERGILMLVQGAGYWQMQQRAPADGPTLNYGMPLRYEMQAASLVSAHGPSTTVSSHSDVSFGHAGRSSCITSRSGRHAAGCPGRERGSSL